MPYAAITDLQNCYRTTVLMDLVTDGDGGRPASLTGNSVLTAVLSQAAGLINSAVLKGERYAVTDLEGLTVDDQALLVRINCDLAYGLLARRASVDPIEPPAEYLWAEEMLGRLASGETVFNVQGAEEAGVPSANFTSFTDRWTIRGIRDRCARLYPVPTPQQVPSD